MSNAIKLVLVGVSTIVLTALLVGAFSFVETGKDSLKSSIEKVNGVVTLDNQLERELTTRKLSGVDVTYYAGKLNRDGVGVLVVTKHGNTYIVENLKDTNSNCYVRGSAEFYADVIVDEDDALLGVRFQEVGTTEVAFDYERAHNAANNTATAAVYKKQLKIWEDSREVNEIYSEIVEALAQKNDAMKEMKKAELLKEDAKTDENTITTGNKPSYYTRMAEHYRAMSDFYKELTDAIQSWINNDWFAPLVYDDIYFDESEEDEDDGGGEDEDEDDETVFVPGDSSGGATEAPEIGYIDESTQPEINVQPDPEGENGGTNVDSTDEPAATDVPVVGP